MGVFDFLYKTRPRQERVQPRRYHPSQPSPHYKQRTATYVPNRANSLPNDEDPAPQYERQSPATRSSRSYNQKHDSSHYHEHRAKADAVDYYRQAKPAMSESDDDFTRLSRLEIKIDSYIERYNKLSNELNGIERDLGLILNEFNDEFQDSIAKSDNRHTREIGVRILDKLNNFCTIDNAIELRTNHTVKSEPRKKPQSQPPPPPQQAMPSSAPQSYINSEPEAEYESANIAAKTNRANVPPKEQRPTYQPVRSPQPTYQPSPLINSTSAHSSHPNEHDFAYNHMTGPDKQNGDYNRPQLVKAQYAMVNSSTPYTTDTVTRLTHYKSTPSLLQPNQTLAYDSPSLSSYPMDDTYVADPNQSRMYINMSMVMHSDHPVIEHCFRRIEILRPRIMGYRSEHKLSVYKELDTEIIRLMNRLDSVDCGNDNTFQQDKNIALCELHNLAGVLERAIECTDPECVICNSFIYKQEVSV